MLYCRAKKRAKYLHMQSKECKLLINLLYINFHVLHIYLVYVSKNAKIFIHLYALTFKAMSEIDFFSF